MRKLCQPELDDGPPPHRWKFSSALTIMVGFMLAPFAYEGGSLCIARWKAMVGPSPPVKTPAFDMAGRLCQWVKEDLQDFARPVTRHTTWKASYMIPLIMFTMAVGVILLRKC